MDSSRVLLIKHCLIRSQRIPLVEWTSMNDLLMGSLGLEAQPGLLRIDTQPLQNVLKSLLRGKISPGRGTDVVKRLQALMFPYRL